MTNKTGATHNAADFSGDEISRSAAHDLHSAFRSFSSLVPHLAVAALLAIAAFALYVATMPECAVPGQPADTLERIAGLRHNVQPRFFVWRHLFATAIAMLPTRLSLAAGVFCALFSALGVGAIYLALSQMVWYLFDRETWALRQRRIPLKAAYAVSMSSGVAAALALGTSAPYWTTATQAYPYAFHLAWFLLAVFFLFRFAVSSSLLSFLLFSLLYASGLAQTSIFLAHLPLVFGFLALLLWTGSKLPLRKYLGVLLLFGAVAGLVLSANAIEYASSMSLLGEHKTFFAVAKELSRAITGGIMGAIPRAWWLILLGLTVLPWLACLVVAKRGVNGEKSLAVSALHGAVAITVVCVLLDLRFSPWQFYNVESLQIVPYAMTALAFGYLVAHLVALALLGTGGDQAEKRRAARRALACSLLGPLCAAFALWHNSDDADPRASEGVFRYVDAAIDGMKGRTWLVTPGLLDSSLRLRAAERGIDLKLVNISAGNGPRAMSEFAELLPDISLRNAANIGPVALLREWISRRPDADKEIALSLIPDFWHLGPFEDIPSGVVFLGTPSEADETPDLDGAVRTVEADMDSIGKALGHVGENATARTRFYAAFVRQRTSQAGNNVAYLLERAKRQEDAWNLYEKVAEFDPDNISCLLNRASLFRKGMHPEAGAKIEEELNDLQSKLASSKIDVRSNLASSFGYVSSPSAFLDLGWRWAMSGMSTLAINSLHRAMESADVEHQGRIRGLIADVYRQNGDLESSEAAYMAVLKEDPGVPDALIGLVRLCVVRGDFAAARKHLEQARIAGVPQERLLFETAALDLAAGDVDQAAIAAQRLMDFNPDSKDALVLMSLIHSTAFERAVKGSAERKSALEALHGVVAELVRVAGDDDFQTRFVRGRVEVLEGRFAEARDDFVAALRLCKGADRIAVLGAILHMDFSLDDKTSAERHAKETLVIAPDHSFANYILGSIMLGREQHSSAEAYLTRALAAEKDYVPALNDLAMAQYALRKYDAAEATARRVLSIHRDFYSAWDTLGLVLLAKGDANEAYSAFETAMQLEDTDPRVLLHVAMALAAKGDMEGAKTRAAALYASAYVFTGQDSRDFENLRRKLKK